MTSAKKKHWHGCRGAKITRLPLPAEIICHFCLTEAVHFDWYFCEMDMGKLDLDGRMDGWKYTLMPVSMSKYIRMCRVPTKLGIIKNFFHWMLRGDDHDQPWAWACQLLDCPCAQIRLWEWEWPITRMRVSIHHSQSSYPFYNLINNYFFFLIIMLR